MVALIKLGKLELMVSLIIQILDKMSKVNQRSVQQDFEHQSIWQDYWFVLKKQQYVRYTEKDIYINTYNHMYLCTYVEI